jgi:hypothetical protein
MNFLKKLFSSPGPTSRYYQFQVKCKRCGEIIDGRVDLYNDPSVDYEGQKPVYICRKVVMGSSHCYQQVEVTFKFDENRKVLEKTAVGGDFI